MWNRWAALPRGIRWAVGIAAVVLAVAVVWVLFVPAADWLAHHDVGSAKGPLHETALDNARGRLLTLGAGLFAAGALVFTARNFTLSREGQVTDRYSKAIEQLGSEKLDVRIGGIYALERVARDSARDHPTVMEVLTAFIREHSHERWPPSDPGGREQQRSTRPDVQAATTVIGRRDGRRDLRPINLSDANLAHANLASADLADAHLTRAHLDDADLTGAKLTSAHLIDAILADAQLADADLTGARLAAAYLTRARLTGAILTDAHLANTDLIRADFTGAHLASADFTGADLSDAHLAHANLAGAVLAEARLRGADLTDADLTGAVLVNADLAGADLAGARWPADTPAPEGWELDTGSGLLKRAATDSDPGGTDGSQNGGSSE